MVKRKEDDVIGKKEMHQSLEDLNKSLIENFTHLQKVMTHLAIKFDSLSDNMAKLLQLFELSARTFIDKSAPTEAEKDQEFLGKLNMLLDQNKTIAKGLTLMEEKMRERLYGQRSPPPQQSQPSQNLQPLSSSNPQSGFSPSVMQTGEIKKLPKV